jgi:uncharacterized protein YndB with AHSA1/START domain
MTSDVVTRDIIINASPETVYDVVSQPEHIVKWFSDEAELRPVLGADGVLVFNEGAHGVATVEVTVVTASRPHLFAFCWISPDRQRATPDATGTVLVEFRITAQAGGTRLVVSESGLDALDWDDRAKAAYSDDHGHGWENFLSRLRPYAEGLVPHGSS